MALNLEARIFSALAALFIAAVLVSPASADTGRPASSTGVTVHGSLRGMLHDGQTGSVVNLASLLPNPALYGVGALADLDGEVTIIGGTAYLSYPDGEDHTRTTTTVESDTGAALLVTAEVTAWQRVAIEESITFENLDGAIGTLAAKAGLDLEVPFPFLLEGQFTSLKYHVVDGSRLEGKITSHEDHLAAAVQTTRNAVPATLVGFYTQGPPGVFTHMGSRTHVHCVMDEPVASGHVDDVTVPAGTTLLLPATPGERPAKSKGSR